MISFYSKNLTIRLFRLPVTNLPGMFVSNGPNVNK